DAAGASRTPLGDVLTHRLGDALHGGEIVGRGGREARLDDVHTESRKCACHLELLVGGKRGARRLLAVSQRGGENSDVIVGGLSHGSSCRSAFSMVLGFGGVQGPALPDPGSSGSRGARSLGSLPGLDGYGIDEGHHLA